MMADIPTWAFLITHLLTGGVGGIATAYLTSRGSARKGDAAVISATTERDKVLWSRMDAQVEWLEDEVERLDSALKKEKRECDERTTALEEEVEELKVTVDILVDHMDAQGLDLPSDVEVGG